MLITLRISRRFVLRRLHHDGIQFHQRAYLPELIDQLQLRTIAVIAHFREHFRKGCRRGDIAGMKTSLFLKKGREVPKLQKLDQKEKRPLAWRRQKSDCSFY